MLAAHGETESLTGGSYFPDRASNAPGATANFMDTINISGPLPTPVSIVVMLTIDSTLRGAEGSGGNSSGVNRSLWVGALLEVGDNYQLVDAGARISIALPAGLSYTSASGVFPLPAVPEPATGAMMLLGLAALGRRSGPRRAQRSTARPSASSSAGVGSGTAVTAMLPSSPSRDRSSLAASKP